MNNAGNPAMPRRANFYGNIDRAFGFQEVDGQSEKISCGLEPGG
jgi:hypothetical protein